MDFLQANFYKKNGHLLLQFVLYQADFPFYIAIVSDLVNCDFKVSKMLFMTPNALSEIIK